MDGSQQIIETLVDPGILHQPLISRKCLKNAKIAQNYERAMVHEPLF